MLQGSRPLHDPSRGRLAVVYGCENNAREDGTPTGPFVSVKDVVKGLVIYAPDMAGVGQLCVWLGE